MNFCAAMFNYWRGDLKIRLVFPSCTLLRFRVGIMMAAPGQVISAFNGNGSLGSLIVDVVGTTEVTFLLPYANGYRMTSTVPVSTVSSSPELPSFAVFLLDAVVGPTGAPQPLFDAYVEPGEDFELLMPTTRYMNTFYTSQGMAEDTMGTKVVTFEQLAKRACPVGTFVPQANTNSTNALTYNFPADGWDPASTLTGFGGVSGYGYTMNNNQWSFARFIASSSLGWSGGSVWRGFVSYLGSSNIILQPADRLRVYQATQLAGCGQVNDTYGVSNPTYPNSGGNGIQVFKDGMFEVALSDYERAAFKSTGLLTWANTGPSLCYCLCVDVPNIATATVVGAGMELYHSAADDVRYGMWLPPTWVSRA